jgi:hypothetical protein
MTSAAKHLYHSAISSSFSYPQTFARGSWTRVSRRKPCPVCNKFDFCEVANDGLTVHCMRIPSAQPLAFRQGGWLHKTGFGSQEATAADLRPTRINQSLNSPNQDSSVSLPLAPVSDRHKAISFLLEQLDLSETHLEYLGSEGFTPEKARQLGYRTLPAQGRDRLVRALVEKAGAESARRLAFIFEKKGKAASRYFQFAAPRAEVLLIPIRDKDGNFLGLKGRWTTINEETGEIERNYRILSAGSSGGASLGTPLHVATPATKIEQDRIIITEGEKKADYIALRTGRICLGVQGTGNWRATRGKEHLVAVLASLGVTTVEVAFDADMEKNQRVARDLYQMNCQLQAAGFQVFERRWPLTAAKGYDDLLRSGQGQLSRLEIFSGELDSIEKKETRWVKKFIELDPETREVLQFSQPGQKIRPLLTVQEARQKHAGLFKQTFSEHFFTLGKTRQSLLVTSNPGTGKTHAALAEALAAVKNFPEGRILYIADNKEVYRQWIKPDALLHEAWQSGLVAVREGRQRAQGAFECRKLDECEAAGSQRHAATWDVCSACPFFSAKNWQDSLKATKQSLDTPMPWNCQQEGYWKGVATANQARIVLAPKASFLNNSHELAEFDVIIIDESVIEHLLENVSVTRETLALWRESMQRQAQDANQEDFFYTGWQDSCEPFVKLFGLIEQAMALQESASLEQDQNRAQKLFPFMPVLTEAARLTGSDLSGIINDCLAIPTGTKTGRYNWERPFAQLNGKLCFPLHFARELVTALKNELISTISDTRLWFNLQKESLALAVYQPRQHLVKLLKGEIAEGETHRNQFQQAPSVVLLDATPSPVLQSYVLSQDTKIVNFEVAQHLDITQVTNSLYTKDELVAREGKALKEVSRMLEQESGKYRSAAIFCHKAFNPAAGAGPLNLTAGTAATRITWGHFDRDNKAMNGLSEVEFIAVVGHYCHPLDSLRAQVQAFRFGAAVEGTHKEEKSIWKIRPYAWTNEEGKGIARRCRADGDLEVQAAIEHSEQAAILQAIGRGRPTLRSADKPLKVLVVTAIPLGNCLPVARLAETKELLGENIISQAQAQALAKGRNLRLSQHQARRSIVAQRLIETLEQASEAAGNAGRAYLTQKALARLSGTPGWQLSLLGINRTVRLQPGNKAVCGPELYLYFYKQLQFHFPFVFNHAVAPDRLTEHFKDYQNAQK